MPWPANERDELLVRHLFDLREQRLREVDPRVKPLVNLLLLGRQCVIRVLQKVSLNFLLMIRANVPNRHALY